jgi:hypothetical protein
MKKFKVLSICIILTICMISINSCKHDNIVGFEGPAQCVSADFAVTQAFSANSTVNFSTDSVTFTAAFNEVTSWTITVTGQTSGATVSFSGKSNTINTVWRGNPGSIVFFQVEQVTAELKVPCRDAITITLNITGKPNFNNYGYLISDFDGHGHSQAFNFYKGAGYIGTFGVMNAPLVSPQGGNYYHVNGTTSPASWYYGEAGCAAAFSLTSLGTTNADSVYFNVLINNNGVSTGTVNILLQAVDRYSSVVKLNGGAGWKLVSLKLSDFKPSTAGPSVNPKQITSVAFDLGPASNMGDPAEIDIDLVIFTKGHPFF